MKIGIVSDIHCNATALQLALERMGAIDALLCLGDAIYDYRFSNDVVALLRERNATTIMGNHEQGYFAARRRAGGPDPRADETLSAWLSQQPDHRRLTLGGKRILMVHSTPWQPRGDYIYPHNPALSRFASDDADIVLYGHTHVSLVRRIRQTLIVNPGSAGEPRNDGSGPATSCAVLDLPSEEATIIQVPSS